MWKRAIVTETEDNDNTKIAKILVVGEGGNHVQISNETYRTMDLDWKFIRHLDVEIPNVGEEVWVNINDDEIKKWITKETREYIGGIINQLGMVFDTN